MPKRPHSPGAGSASNNEWQSGMSSTAANEYMFENSIQSDVEFLFKCKREDGTIDPCRQWLLAAHKYILVSRSPVFFAMFYGSFQEPKDGISITDIEYDIFREMLRYMYTDKVKLTNETALDMLYAANKYQITNLNKECKRFLLNHMTSQNAVVILNHAIFYGYQSLRRKSLNFIKDQVHQDFTSLNQHHVSRETLRTILEERELLYQEKDLFAYCNQWATYECERLNIESSGINRRNLLGDLMFKIRLGNVDPKDVTTIVTPSGLLTDQEELDVYRYINKAKNVTIPFTTGKRTSVFSAVWSKTLNGLHFTLTTHTEWLFCGLMYGESARAVQDHVTINDLDRIKVKVDSKYIMLPSDQCRALKDHTTALCMDISKANRVDIRVYLVGTMPHERIQCDKWPNDELGPLRFYRFSEKRSLIEGVVFRRRIRKRSQRSGPSGSGTAKREFDSSATSATDVSGSDAAKRGFDSSATSATDVSGSELAEDISDAD